MASSIASQAEAFLIWWGRELRSLAPPGMVTSARGNRTTVVRPQRDGKYTLRRGEGAPVRGGAFALATALAATDADPGVVLRMAENDVLVLSTDLPERAMGRARDILSLEIESATPFAASEATFDYLVAAEADGGIRRVKTFVVKNSIVEQCVNDLAKAGVAINKVDVEGAEAINLLPPHLKKKRGIPLRRDYAVLLGALLLLVASIYHRQDLAIRDLEKKRTALFSETEGVRHAAAAANAAAANIASLESQLEANPSALYVMGALTTALGDDAWLTDLKISGREVAISGVASSASEVLAALESSPAFADAAFTSTVFTDQIGKGETFSAKFHVETPSPAGGKGAVAE